MAPQLKRMTTVTILRFNTRRNDNWKEISKNS